MSVDLFLHILCWFIVPLILFVWCIRQFSSRPIWFIVGHFVFFILILSLKLFSTAYNRGDAIVLISFGLWSAAIAGVNSRVLRFRNKSPTVVYLIAALVGLVVIFALIALSRDSFLISVDKLRYPSQFYPP